jgi:hypothetical protein
MTPRAKEPRVATQALPTIPPVVVETTPMQAPRMRIVGAMEGTIVRAVSPPAIAIRAPGVARARMQTGVNVKIKMVSNRQSQDDILYPLYRYN